MGCPVGHDRDVQVAGDAATGGAGCGVNGVFTGGYNPAKIIIAIPIEGMLAAAPVAAVQEGSDRVLPFIPNFDRGPGGLGEVKGQTEKPAFFRQPWLESTALG
jgi:hypothetical protein